MKKAGLQAPTIVRLALAVICLFISIGLLGSIIGHLRRSDVVGEHRQVLQIEQKRNQDLNDRLKEATSTAFIEKQAREKLGLARAGDTIVLIQSPIQAQPIGVRVGNDRVSRWKSWWKLFF